mgnify:CR=1 FL=1
MPEKPAPGISITHAHEDIMHDSDYSQTCDCGAVRLRQSGSREWEPWHVCALCALNQNHGDHHAEG